MSQSSESRFRGPLIAVIKIEIDNWNNDKIYLHLNDDDQQVAEQFINKHQLNPSLVLHIVHQIKLSRIAIQNKNKNNTYNIQQISYKNNVALNKKELNTNKDRNKQQNQDKQQLLNINIQQQQIKNIQKQSNLLKTPQNHNSHRFDCNNYEYRNQDYQQYKNKIQNRLLQSPIKIIKQQKYYPYKLKNYTKQIKNSQVNQHDYHYNKLHYNQHQLKCQQKKQVNMGGTFGQLYQSQGNNYKNINNNNNNNNDINSNLNNNLVRHNFSNSNHNKIQDKISKTNSNNIVSVPSYSQRMAELYNINGIKLGFTKTTNIQTDSLNLNEDFNQNTHKLIQQNKNKYDYQRKQIMYSSSGSQSVGLFQKQIYQKQTNNKYQNQNQRQKFHIQQYNNYHIGQSNLHRNKQIYDNKTKIEKFVQVQQKNYQNYQDYKRILNKFKKLPKQQTNLNVFNKNKSNNINHSQTQSSIYKYVPPIIEPSYPQQSSGSFDYISFKNTQNNKKIQNLSNNYNHQKKQANYNNQQKQANYNHQKKLKNYTNQQKLANYNQNNDYSVKLTTRPLVAGQQNYQQSSLKNKIKMQKAQKKIGLIRSNSNTKSLLSYAKRDQSSRRSPSESVKQQTVYNRTIANTSREQDFEQTRRFNQDQLFNQIKDIKNHNLQKNITNKINKFQQTNKPLNIKILHKQDIQNLRKSTMSRSMSKSHINKINKQVTNRLYNQDQIKIKYLNRIKSKAKNLKDQQEIEKEELTHRPQINQLSKLIAGGRKKQNVKIEQYLIEKAKQREIKVQQKITEQARKQLQQCSFKPIISQLSHKIANSRSRSRISTLSEAKYLQNNKSSTNFRPEINKLSSQIAKTKGNFEQRQQKFQQQKNGKLFKKIQQQRMKQKADIISGRMLYQPVLTQRSKKLAQQNKQSNRNQNQPVYSYLYQLSKQQKVIKKLDQRPVISTQSQKMVLEMYEKRLIWLFSELDSDQDGVVSSRKICIDSIPTEILQIIAPVLYQMQELSTELSLQDFKNAVKILHKNLDPYEKSVLYNYKYSAKQIRN